MIDQQPVRAVFLSILLSGFVINSLARASDKSSDWRQTLFDGIESSGSGLQEIRDAVDKHDLPAAEHVWADYLRHRMSVPWTFDPHNPIRNTAFKDPIADAAAVGTVQGGGVPIVHVFGSNNIDWSFNATTNVPGVPFNPEWQVQLCRMQFWYNLGAAYRATGDEKYATAWVTQLRSFIAQAPPPEARNGSTPGTWRTIEAGIRMSGSWPAAFYSFLLSPAFTDDDVAAYSYFVMMHGRFLHNFPSSGNWLTIEMSGLYAAGCLFPEMKESAEWRSFASKRMRAEETTQFLPDGAQYELSPGYHNTALECLTGIIHIAKLVGRLNELPEGYVAALEKAYDYDLYLMAPDGLLPKFNDSGWSVPVRYCCRNALEFFPDRTDFKWIWTQHKEGLPPAMTSYQFPWAGFYVMRSSWESDANCMILRAGPPGAGHQHQDKLNTLFWAYGREMLFDSGGGSYEHSKFRDYELSTFGHNTILVDGKPQERQLKDRSLDVSHEPIDARWESTPTFDYAAGSYADGYGTITDHIAKHTRRVMLIKPDVGLIIDTLEPADSAEHTYQARWNLNTTHTTRDASTLSVTTQDDRLPNLALIPLQTHNLDVRAVSGQSSPEVLGWYVFKDHVPAQVPATTVLHTITGTGVQSMATFLLPMKPGAPYPVNEIQQVSSDSWRIRFNNGRQIEVTVDPKPTGGMTVNEQLADGTSGAKIGVPSTAPSSN